MHLRADIPTPPYKHLLLSAYANQLLVRLDSEPTRRFAPPFPFAPFYSAQIYTLGDPRRRRKRESRKSKKNRQETETRQADRKRENEVIHRKQTTKRKKRIWRVAFSLDHRPRGAVSLSQKETQTGRLLSV